MIIRYAFFKTKRPLVIQPVMYCRNSLRGVISLRCEKVESETLLHITIAPMDKSLFVWSIFCFSIEMSVFMLCAGVWQGIIPLFMPIVLLVFLAICRSAGEYEIPKIRQAFENQLWVLEGKYKGAS